MESIVNLWFLCSVAALFVTAFLCMVDIMFIHKEVFNVRLLSVATEVSLASTVISGVIKLVVWS